MKRLIIIVISGLYITQVVFAEGRSASSNSQVASTYIIGPGIVKRAPVCDLIDPIRVYERLSHVSNPYYVCFTDTEEYFTHVARTADDDSVEIELNFEDNFDGTWYGSVFEYKEDAVDALPSAIYNYDLTLEQVQACRTAFEPPFDCSEPY